MYPALDGIKNCSSFVSFYLNVGNIGVLKHVFEGYFIAQSIGSIVYFATKNLLP